MSPRGSGRRPTEEEWEAVASAYREMRKRRRRSRLFRDTEDAWIGGVCAGIGQYLGIENWIVRLVVIAIMFFGGFLVVAIVYGILWIVLDPAPVDDLDWEPVDDSEVEVRSSTIRTSPKLGLRVVSEDLRNLDLRLRRLETYVTSNEFNIDRSFREMG